MISAARTDVRGTGKLSKNSSSAGGSTEEEEEAVVVGLSEMEVMLADRGLSTNSEKSSQSSKVLSLSKLC